MTETGHRVLDIEWGTPVVEPHPVAEDVAAAQRAVGVTPMRDRLSRLAA